MTQSTDSLLDVVRKARLHAAAWIADDFAVCDLDGPDAIGFLNNLTTADIRPLGIGQGVVAFQCTPRGMPETQLHIFRISENTWRVLNRTSDMARLLEHFDMMHFSEQFEIHDRRDELSMLALQGARSPEVIVSLLQQDEESLSALRDAAAFSWHSLKVGGGEVEAVKVSLTGDPGFLVIAAGTGVAALREQLNGLEEEVVFADPNVRETLRIEGGVLKMGTDIRSQGVAQEVGIDHPAFSYSQGCYVGQEIIARIQTKGEVPFILRGVLLSGDGELPAAGTALVSDDGKRAGEITSATFSPMLGRNVAIARMGRGFQLKGAVVLLDGTTCKVVDLPFATAQSLQADGDKRSKLYDEALSLFARDKEEEAIELLEQELASNPENFDAWEALGVIHDRQGRHHEAIKAMKHITDAQPDHLMANVNLSLYHMKIGDKQTAEDYQSKATQISLQRRIEEARREGKDVPLDAQAEQMQKLESRLDKFKAIIEMDPDDVLGYFGAGRACLDLKRFGEAVEHFRKVVELQRDYTVAWANLGTAFAALGETDAARETFETGIEVGEEKGDMMPVRDMQTRLRNLDTSP